MNSSAMERALAVPEMLAVILNLLKDDTHALLSAVRVNSFWNRHAAYVLWKDPPSRALLGISRERRQLYAGVVRNLTFDGGDDIEAHSEYIGLQFPQLRYISIDANGAEEPKPRIGQYFQANLRGFEFNGGNVHEDLTQLLSEHCPKLTRLALDNIGSDIRSDNFVPFLQHFNALEDVSLHFQSERVTTIPTDVFCYLAGIESLKSLALRNLIEEDTVQRAKKTITTPFRHLAKLQINVQTNALHTIVPMIDRVKQLRLLMSSDMDLKALWSLQDLESLSVEYFNWATLDSEDLTPVKKFTKLRELGLPALGYGGLPDLSHDTLSGIFKCLPLLELVNLSFNVDMEDSIEILTALGESCPRLQSVSLDGVFGLKKLSSFPVPLFPALQMLEVDALLDEEYDMGPQGAEEPRLNAMLIRTHMPKLEELSMDDESSFSQDVYQCWEDLREEDEHQVGKT